MKQIVILIISLFVIVNISFAQEVQTKTKMFGVNPFGLIINLYSGHYGQITNDGANELNFPFFFWKSLSPEDQPKDDITMLGAGAKYRIYKNGKGKGAFYGGTINVMSINWEYEYFDMFSGFATETITGVTFTPGGEVGYRWSWDNGFTFAPTIGGGYTIGKIEASDGTEADIGIGSAGFAWSLGLGLAYMF